MNDFQKKKGRAGALFFTIAMTAGAAVLGMLLAPRKGEETQKKIREHVENIAKKFKKSSEDIQDTLDDIFGEITDDLEKTFYNIREEIVEMIGDASEKAELTKETYRKIVEHVVDEFTRNKHWSEKIAGRISKTLEDKWEEVNK